ncbi:MAG TPA: cytochrome c oxidase subunit II [Acidimicrobiales bacterium]|nr:cytochrome c oxidase subunit II [Acidimicrobiales bacterium]
MDTENSNKAEPRHLRRITVIWIVLSVVGDLLYWFLVGPHTPPGRMTSSAVADQFDFNVLFVVAFPVIIGVWTYMLYAVVNWRSGKAGAPEPVGGPSATGNKRTEVSWIAITTFAVLCLAAFGIVELVVGQGSGGGEGPNPLWAFPGAIKADTAALAGTGTWTPNSNAVLPVQVIAQQWKFTYRYPTFGGFESPQLILPNNTRISFNVTSLDVIHSFWAYQLSVKADANPQINNVAFTKTQQLGNFTVRCDELCGIWHGAMFNYGKVVSQSAFMTWATKTEAANAQNTAILPAFAWTYVPDANGAAGGYYPDGSLTPYSSVETYGSKQPKS